MLRSLYSIKGEHNSLFFLLSFSLSFYNTMFFMNQQRDIAEKKINVNPVTKTGHVM